MFAADGTLTQQKLSSHTQEDHFDNLKARIYFKIYFLVDITYKKIDRFFSISYFWYLVDLSSWE